MTKFSDPAIPLATERDVTDFAKWFVGAANVQATTPGAKAKFNWNMVVAIVHSRIISAPAHGLTSTDEGKPLSGTSVFNDTNAAHYPNCVLAQVINANTLRIQVGGPMEVDNDLLQAGYNRATHGPYLFWDLSAGRYVHTRPNDSWTGAREILYVYSVGSTTFSAEILGWGPQG